MTVICIPFIGFSFFYVCLVCGQIVSAMIIDGFGLFGVTSRKITWNRIMGCCFTLVGTVCIFLTDESKKSVNPVLVIGFVLCAIISGMALPVQAAINNVLKREDQLDTMTAVAISMFTGAILLSIIVAFSYIWIPAEYDTSLRFYHWLGGVVGLLYVASGVQFSPIIGYATFFVSIIAGQLFLSLVSDILGWLGPPKDSAKQPLSIFGVILAAIGVALVSLINLRNVQAKDQNVLIYQENIELSQEHFDHETMNPLNCEN
jgi:transporter family-2 protein